MLRLSSKFLRFFSKVSANRLVVFCNFIAGWLLREDRALLREYMALLRAYRALSAVNIVASRILRQEPSSLDVERWGAGVEYHFQEIE